MDFSFIREIDGAKKERETADEGRRKKRCDERDEKSDAGLLVDHLSGFAAGFTAGSLPEASRERVVGKERTGGWGIREEDREKARGRVYGRSSVLTSRAFARFFHFILET